MFSAGILILGHDMLDALTNRSIILLSGLLRLRSLHPDPSGQVYRKRGGICAGFLPGLQVPDARRVSDAGRTCGIEVPQLL